MVRMEDGLMGDTPPSVAGGMVNVAIDPGCTTCEIALDLLFCAEPRLVAACETDLLCPVPLPVTCPGVAEK